MKTATIAMVVVGVACLAGCGEKVEKQEKPLKGSHVIRKRAKKLKPIYKYEEWAGKVKRAGKIDTLDFHPEDFSDLGKVNVYTPKVSWGKDFDFQIVGGGGKSNINIHIRRFDSSLAAHNAIMNYFSVCSAPPPSFKNISGNKDGIGDVCFIPTYEWKPDQSEEAVILTVLFARNNIYVRLDQGQSVKNEYCDLLEVAKRIDQRVTEWVTDKDRIDVK